MRRLPARSCALQLPAAQLLCRSRAAGKGTFSACPCGLGAEKKLSTKSTRPPNRLYGRLEMMRTALLGFLVLALFFYLINYPGHVVSILQMIVDGAQNLADAIRKLRLN